MRRHRDRFGIDPRPAIAPEGMLMPRYQRA
jgi:hypothetical protein